MATDTGIDAEVGSIGEGEVRFFRENGWVTVRGLISSALAGDLLERTQRRMGVHGDQLPESGIDAQWQDWRDPSREDERFAAVVRARAIGRICAALLLGDCPVRMLDDRMLVKLPLETNPERGQPTVWHQDWTNRPMDKNALAVWIALGEVTPEMASLRFLSGSHTLGMVGRWFLPLETALDRFPVLREFEISDPPHLQPGDASIHSSYTLHGATANMGDRPRWGYRVAYFPGNSLYTGLPSAYTDGLGLKPWDSLDRPEFPLVYDPADGHAPGIR